MGSERVQVRDQVVASLSAQAVIEEQGESQDVVIVARDDAKPREHQAQGG